MQSEFLTKLKIKHCNLQCSLKVSECKIVKALQTFNQNHPNDEIIWCPKCNGEFFGLKEVGNKTITDYDGGYIKISGTHKHTYKYDFVFTCDCRCGQERINNGTIKHMFTTEDKNWCYHKRIQIKLDRQQKINDQRAKKEKK